MSCKGSFLLPHTPSVLLLADQPPIVSSIQRALRASADVQRVPAMQAYMKTEQPFLGVQAPDRRRILRDAAAQHELATAKDYREAVMALWTGKHREEQYLAIAVAERWKTHRTDNAWTLYERMLRSAENWDTVDPVAINLIGALVRRNRVWESRIAEWRTDDNMWVRRASVLAHLKHKEETNRALLAETVKMLAPEKEFFIRKAIGWALREYAKTDPDWVASLVESMGDALSGLSRREALKHLA